MKTNRPTLIKIGIVAAVLVAVVLYLRQQKEKETETEEYRKRYRKMGKSNVRGRKKKNARRRVGKSFSKTWKKLR